MSIESIQVQHLASGEINVKLMGEHEFARPDAPVTIPYLLTAAMWLLLKDGTVFKKIEEQFGVTFDGSLNIMESPS